MIRSYKFRLYPTFSQERKMTNILNRCREIYNAGLQERRGAWKNQGISISCYDQVNQLKSIRAEHEEYKNIYFDILTDTLQRLDKSFKSFFRRVKAGQKPGYPRFKGKWHYNTFTYPHADRENRIVSGGKRLRVSGIGNIKFKQTQPIQGKIKQISITRAKTGRWYVAFICVDVSKQPLPKTNKSIGLDLGLTHLFTIDTGENIANNRYLKQAELELDRAHRKIAKRKKRSKRRNKMRQQLARKYERVVNIRKDYFYIIATQLVKDYDIICVENLNTQALINKDDNKRAKNITDAAWGTFIQILTYKAEKAGKEVIQVNPRGTSQECSRCGVIVSKELYERWHSCNNCGLELDRDHNAAINILNRGIELYKQHLLDLEIESQRVSTLPTARCGGKKYTSKTRELVRID